MEGRKMTKFAAQTIKTLMDDTAHIAGRKARGAKFVVAVEADDGSWFELDADDQGHAGVLARNAVDAMSARGASCWRVMDGRYLGRAFYSCFEAIDMAEAV